MPNGANKHVKHTKRKKNVFFFKKGSVLGGKMQVWIECA